MTALIAALLPYFPNGLPEDDAEAREMVCRVNLHLLGPLDTDGIESLRRLADSQPEAYTTLRSVLNQIQLPQPA